MALRTFYFPSTFDGQVVYQRERPYRVRMFRRCARSSRFPFPYKERPKSFARNW